MPENKARQQDIELRKEGIEATKRNTEAVKNQKATKHTLEWKGPQVKELAVTGVQEKFNENAPK